eukprot:m.189707 g.189707  ORF g.189707 m.189707 type:complete len:228 (+) comp15632_c0_seq9:240-923(+)
MCGRKSMAFCGISICVALVVLYYVVLSFEELRFLYFDACMADYRTNGLSWATLTKCWGSSPRCVSEDDRQKLQRELQYICQRLNKRNLTYWLEYGTLLGAIREGGHILKHDSDIDVGYFWKDAEKMLNAVGTRYGRTRSLSNTDLVRFEVEGDKIHRHNDVHENGIMDQFVKMKYHDLPKDWYIPTRPVGIGPLKDCHVVAKPEKVLEFLYGNDFMEPVYCVDMDTT